MAEGSLRALVAARPRPHRIVDADGARPYRWGLSVDDRVALEAALDVAAEVVAVGIGGETARECVRSALERGADRGLHVDFDPIDEALGEKHAAVLARVAAREVPDLVVVGEGAPLSGAEIGGFVATQLDWPGVSRVTGFGGAAVDGSPDLAPDELAVQRKLAIGRQEVLALTPPAVLGIDAGFSTPERASLPTLIDGRRADIETVELADVAPGESRFSMSAGATTVERVTPNERWGRGRPPRTGTVESRIYRLLGRDGQAETTAGERIEASPEAAADRAVSFLRDQELL